MAWKRFIPKNKLILRPSGDNKVTRELSPCITQTDETLRRQRAMGNIAMGQSHDHYEKEADQVADQIVAMKSADRSVPNSSIASSKSQGGGQPLTDEQRKYFEPRFGASLGHIRIHNYDRAQQQAYEVNARAFTTEHDIFFASGQYSQGTEEGKRLLAHELTHSLQQTGYRSDALNLRSQLRISSMSGERPVMQRKVDTWGGEWDTDRYTIHQSGQRRSADIKIRFKANNNVNAELIGLSQTVRSIHNKNPGFYINSDKFYKGLAIQSGDAITVNNATGETDEGTRIDRVKSYNNPIYPVDTRPSTSLDDPSTSTSWGQHGYHYTDATGPHHKDATLIDAPGIGSVDVSKDSAQVFETTAIATKGRQAGMYYGSVRWGWRTDSAGNFDKIPFAKVSNGVPSSTFMKAGELWNASKSSTGADTVDLPLVDVQVTTASITLNQGSVMPAISLPTGTRVEVLPGPRLQTTIRVVDGSHTGLVGEISDQDAANLRDERP
ncbi:protein of unknown function [Nitrosomonas marina]|uniref:eCIS core domain-containing protein n=1 Tax=Nitrosomonas marina TaxID=917 RepID=A0A1I0F200_9PROT|nr:DUF4157 domain-containing protein [Nitrosomonas marina]SET51906.1 protein of unknown function [Nitrosomonas marina]